MRNHAEIIHGIFALIFKSNFKKKGEFVAKKKLLLRHDFSATHSNPQNSRV